MLKNKQLSKQTNKQTEIPRYMYLDGFGFFCDFLSLLKKSGPKITFLAISQKYIF